MKINRDHFFFYTEFVSVLALISKTETAKMQKEFLYRSCKKDQGNSVRTEMCTGLGFKRFSSCRRQDEVFSFDDNPSNEKILPSLRALCALSERSERAVKL